MDLIALFKAIAALAFLFLVSLAVGEMVHLTNEMNTISAAAPR